MIAKVERDQDNHKTMSRSVSTFRKPYSAWPICENTIWVQINDPGLDETFSNIKGARRVSYSVAGTWTRTYEMKKSVSWVRGWMNEHLKE